jgi:hypothetical protein
MTPDEVWENEFGNRNEVFDFAGRPVRKNKGYFPNSFFTTTQEELLCWTMIKQ